jgi:hypothetical protein
MGFMADKNSAKIIGTVTDKELDCKVVYKAISDVLSSKNNNSVKTFTDTWNSACPSS